MAMSDAVHPMSHLHLRGCVSSSFFPLILSICHLLHSQHDREENLSCSQMSSVECSLTGFDKRPSLHLSLLNHER
jgi:hypothetical protein